LAVSGLNVATEDETSFVRLVAEAQRQEFRGWDFSFIDGRWRESSTSWDYRQIVLGHLGRANSMLDMGTGGGEFLSSLRPLPAETCATEGFPRNLPLARARLEPLGVEVLETLPGDRLPVEDARFDLVMNRHESFSAHEVHRVLRPGGRFVTQQVGGRDNVRLNQLLGAREEREFDAWTLDSAVQQLEDAGLRFVEGHQEFPETVFFDVGAVVFYLRAIPWQIADFTVEKYRERLAALHDQIQADGCVAVTSHRFHVEARKEEDGREQPEGRLRG
jgi:SAM-dependent methyltransferase